MHQIQVLNPYLCTLSFKTWQCISVIGQYFINIKLDRVTVIVLNIYMFSRLHMLTRIKFITWYLGKRTIEVYTLRNLVELYQSSTVQQLLLKYRIPIWYFLPCWLQLLECLMQFLQNCNLENEQVIMYNTFEWVWPILNQPTANNEYYYSSIVMPATNIPLLFSRFIWNSILKPDLLSFALLSTPGPLLKLIVLLLILL